MLALCSLGLGCGEGAASSPDPSTAETSAPLTHLSTSLGCAWVGRSIGGATPLSYLEPRASQPSLDFIGTDLGTFFHHAGVDYVVFGDATRSTYWANDDAYAVMTDRSSCPKLSFVTQAGPAGPTAAPLRLRLPIAGTTSFVDHPLGANETSIGLSDGRDAFAMSIVHRPCALGCAAGDSCCPAGARDCVPGVCVAGAADGGPFLRSGFFISKFDAAPRSSNVVTAEGTLQPKSWQSIAARAVPRFKPTAPSDGVYQGMPQRPEGAAATAPKLFVWGRPAFAAATQQPTFLLYYDLAEPSVTRWQKPMVFSGLDGAGNPTWQWTDPAQLETPAAVPVIAASTEVVDGVPLLAPGLMSVAWIEELGQWLMIYGGRAAGLPTKGDKLGTRFADDPRYGMVYRTAPHPWGPWSPPQRLWSATTDGGYARGGPMWHPVSNPDMRDPADWSSAFVGGEYGPGIMDRLTTSAGSAVTVRWAMSTLNPYRVWMMESSFSR